MFFRLIYYGEAKKTIVASKRNEEPKVLVAAFDYVRYRLRAGRYSPACIERRTGGVLAIPEKFQHLEQYQVGDTFFLHTQDSLLSWLVMYYTDSIWSHCGMFSEHEQVIDATAQGVVEHGFYDYCDGKNYVVVRRLNLNDEQRNKLLKFIRTQIGSAYGWFQAVVMWGRIVLGVQDRYRISFMLDLLFVLVILWFLGGRTQQSTWIVMAMFWLYLIVVSANMLIRLARKDPRLRIVV